MEPLTEGGVAPVLEEGEGVRKTGSEWYLGKGSAEGKK